MLLMAPSKDRSRALGFRCVAMCNKVTTFYLYLW